MTITRAGISPLFGRSPFKLIFFQLVVLSTNNLSHAYISLQGKDKSNVRQEFGRRTVHGKRKRKEKEEKENKKRKNKRRRKGRKKKKASWNMNDREGVVNKIAFKQNRKKKLK